MHPVETKEKVIALRKEGKTTREVAKLTGLDTGTVSRWSIKAGINRTIGDKTKIKQLKAKIEELEAELNALKEYKHDYEAARQENDILRIQLDTVKGVLYDITHR